MMSLPVNADFNATVNSFNKANIGYTQVSCDSNNNTLAGLVPVLIIPLMHDIWYLIVFNGI